MNRKNAIALIVALFTGLAAHAADGNKTDTKKPAAPKKQTNCPVMQRTPIDKSLYVDVKGKRVYTCCSGCIAQVKGNPDKYIKRLEDKGIVLEKTPEIKKGQ